MTKTLTEKWRNGTLEEDFYYVKNKSCLGVEIDYYHVLHSGIKYWSGCEDEDVEEVLAKVPTYDEFVDLTEKVEGLEQDNKCLKSGINTYESQLSCISEQLKEAEEVIKFYSDARQLTEEEKQMTAEKYHLVYGLKANDYLERYDVK